MTFLSALPESHYCHYSNPQSQGSLIRESKDWPKEKNCGKQKEFTNPWGEYAVYKGRSSFRFGEKSYSAEVTDGAKQASAYSDRISSWDYKRYQAANEIAGTGCQGWSRNLKNLSEKEFLCFAAVALNLEDKKILAARAIHHYNVGNGYSCPTIEAIYLEP